MLIKANLDWGVKDMGESGLKGSRCKRTHTHTHTVRVKQEMSSFFKTSFVNFSHAGSCKKQNKV